VKKTAQKKAVISQKAVSQESFSVEHIVDGPRVGDGRYLLKWTGYPDADNTWEPKSHLSAKLLKDFEQKKAGPKSVGAPPSTFEGIAAAALGKEIAAVPPPARAVPTPTPMTAPAVECTPAPETSKTATAVERTLAAEISKAASVAEPASPKAASEALPSSSPIAPHLLINPYARCSIHLPFIYWYRGRI
jgi:hypothetical protein